MAVKKRTIALACTTIALSMATLASGSYALFTDVIRESVHLQAGSLDAGLTRTKLITITLNNQTGRMEQKENTQEIDFEKSDENVFGLTSDTKLVPGCQLSAEMKLSNVDVVAFDYWLEIDFADGTNLSTLSLDDQMEMTVYVSDTVQCTSTLANGAFLGNENNPIGTLETGKAQTFTVTITFQEGDDNYSAMGETLDFDLVVYAKQNTDVV